MYTTHTAYSSGRRLAKREEVRIGKLGHRHGRADELRSRLGKREQIDACWPRRPVLRSSACVTRLPTHHRVQLRPAQRGSQVKRDRRRQYERVDRRSERPARGASGLAALLGEVERVGDGATLRSAWRRHEHEDVGASVDYRDARRRWALDSLGLNN